MLSRYLIYNGTLSTFQELLDIDKSLLADSPNLQTLPI